MPNIADVMELPGSQKYYFYFGYYMNLKHEMAERGPNIWYPISGVVGFQNNEKHNPVNCYSATVKSVVENLTKQLLYSKPELFAEEDIKDEKFQQNLMQTFRLYFDKFEKID